MIPALTWQTPMYTRPAGIRGAADHCVQGTRSPAFSKRNPVEGIKGR